LLKNLCRGGGRVSEPGIGQGSPCQAVHHLSPDESSPEYTQPLEGLEAVYNLRCTTLHRGLLKVKLDTSGNPLALYGNVKWKCNLDNEGSRLRRYIRACRSLALPFSNALRTRTFANSMAQKLIMWWKKRLPFKNLIIERSSENLMKRSACYEVFKYNDCSNNTTKLHLVGYLSPSLFILYIL